MFFFFPHGWRTQSDVITPGPGGREFTLGEVTAPLDRHKKNLVVLENMEMRRPVDKGFQHAMGRAQLWTGRYSYGDDGKIRAKGISLDRHLGKVIGSGATLGLPLLSQRMFDTGGQRLECSFDESGADTPGNANPYEVYDNVFRGLTIGRAKADPAQVAALARTRSVLGTAAAELSEFRRRLGPEDRLRAEAQLDAIASMEARLGGLKASGAHCAKPRLPEAIPVPDPSGRGVSRRAEVQMDLIAAAFACGLTRVASYQAMGGQSLPLSFPPVGAAIDWHSASHANTPPFREAGRWVFGLAAGLADRLEAIPEAGGTLLDNTLIVMASEIGPAHRMHNLVMFSIGGKNLGVKVGQHLRLGRGTEFGGGESHNHWLVSMMNLMGVPGDTFGDTTELAGRGPLAGYQV